MHASSHLYIALLILLNHFSALYCWKSSGFNLYYTDKPLSTMDRDCLHYLVPEFGLNYQFIQYCIRFQLGDEKLQDNITQYHRAFTFDDLRRKKIKSDQLIAWSAPIDLVERYQMYLDNTTSASLDVFNNCTYPWFGSFCEYRFDNPWPTFNEQRDRSSNRQIFSDLDTYYTHCYTYVQCNRAGDFGRTPGICLDWREVCDGKVDCIDGGQDEENCWQLEINECDPETEFRCQIGLCIPLTFLHDDAANPDCLDRTDESGTLDILTVIELPLNYEAQCEMDPSFRCEDHGCRPSASARFTISSGEGDCSLTFNLNPLNRRVLALSHGILIGAGLSDSCQLAFNCVVSFSIYNDTLKNDCDFEQRKLYAFFIKAHCPSLTVLPPIMFGHVQFVYTNDQIEVSATQQHILIAQPHIVKESK